MKAVVQCVKSARLFVNDELVSEIDKGFVVFLGVKKGDRDKDIELIAKKISSLRVFVDENGRMNYDLAKIKGHVLLVSQFTLLADCSHGSRPSFFNAESPDLAKIKYLKVKELLEKLGVTVKLGVFGEDMKILQSNDGPVTIILDSEEINSCKNKDTNV